MNHKYNVAAITDRCICMKPRKAFSWDEWWDRYVKGYAIPNPKSYAYWKWIQSRLYFKKAVNMELEKRKRPERLVCCGGGVGVYLVDKNDVAELTADVRLRKIVNSFNTGAIQMNLLAGCVELSLDDRNMLGRLSSLVELQQNTMLGTMAKMRSLPPATKKRILKHLGIDSK